jgi:carbon monoxide dehydrogenase subunit G
MKVQLEKTFLLPAGADDAWRHLVNIEEVAECMPGAKIIERIDERNYRGTVAVRFGPAAMSFRGEVEVRELDASTRTLRLLGKGTDSTGTSGASMDLTARIDSVDTVSCQLVGKSEVSMSGKAAAFGGRMMSAVADQVLKQFADNFARLAAAGPATGPDATAAHAPAPAGSAPGSPPLGGDAKNARSLNGFALIWSVIRSWLRALLGKSTA